MNPREEHNDPADWNASSYQPDMSELDTGGDKLIEEFGHLPTKEAIYRVWERYRDRDKTDLNWFIAWALDDHNPAFKLWVAAFASGMEITEGISQTAKARELGVTRAAFSKRVKQLEAQYGFRSRNMKSQLACEAYRQDKKNNHHKYQLQIQQAKNEYNNPSN